MFIGSLDRKLKKLYKSANAEIKELVFPRGEKEFVYVGNALSIKFPNKDLIDLIKLYASTYTYYELTQGNAYETHRYTLKRCNSVLSENEVVTLIAIVSVSIIAKKSYIPDPIAAIDMHEVAITSNIQKVAIIKANPHIFKTKKYGAGEQNNPILVAGVQGVQTYIESLEFMFGIESIKYERTSTVYLTETQTKLNYAIDEYTIWGKTTGRELAKLWFNIYGDENSVFCPSTLNFKSGSTMQIQQEKYFATQRMEEKVKKEQEIKNAIQQNKLALNVDEFAQYLTDKVLDVITNIANICIRNNISYIPEKLFAATSVYYYVFCMILFGNITLGQVADVKGKYHDNIVRHYEMKFKQARYSLTTQDSLRRYFTDVWEKVRTVYLNHNKVLIDENLSKNYMDGFLVNTENSSAIEKEVSNLMFTEWINEAKQIAKEVHIV